MGALVFAIAGLLIGWLIVGVWQLTRRRGQRVTPGTALLSSMDMLFDDGRRAAVEVIVEERTGERDPEDKDGNLPELEHRQAMPERVGKLARANRRINVRTPAAP